MKASREAGGAKKGRKRESRLQPTKTDAETYEMDKTR